MAVDETKRPRKVVIKATAKIRWTDDGGFVVLEESHPGAGAELARRFPWESGRGRR